MRRFQRAVAPSIEYRIRLHIAEVVASLTWSSGQPWTMLPHLPHELSSGRATKSVSLPALRSILSRQQPRTPAAKCDIDGATAFKVNGVRFKQAVGGVRGSHQNPLSCGRLSPIADRKGSNNRLAAHSRRVLCRRCGLPIQPAISVAKRQSLGLTRIYRGYPHTTRAS